MPWVSWVTFLIPGLAQAINRQYIYLIAIPYSLGYGNYKGDGITGLITLVAEGGRLDRSIIFMIEGILAIFLLLIGIFLMLICFKDANKVEKDTIKGTRYKSWIETKQALFEDGFPLFQIAPLLVGQYTFNFNNFSIIALFNNGGPFDPSKYGNLAGSSDLLISYI